MSYDKQSRAEQIAQSGFDVGRNPLDTAGMDTDDEIWVDENPDYSDYIEQVYKELVTTKQQKKSDDPHERSLKIANGGFEVGICPPDPGSMNTDDKEWLDDNLEYIDYVKEQYQKLVDEKK
jgi:hypothetical protein